MNTTTMTKVLSILLVDDHKMVREGLKILLESTEDQFMYDIKEVESGISALNHIKQNEVDLVLMDQQMPGLSGVETVKKIKEINPEIKILAVSNYDEHALIVDMMKAGANGYVLKNIDGKELNNAIETVMVGKNYYANDVAIKLINIAQPSSPAFVPEKRDAISKREMEILKLIAAENTNEQIADKLQIAKRTVDSHRQNLLNKLNVKNTAGLINYAYRNDLI